MLSKENMISITESKIIETTDNLVEQALDLFDIKFNVDIEVHYVNKETIIRSRSISVNQGVGMEDQLRSIAASFVFMHLSIYLDSKTQAEELFESLNPSIKSETRALLYDLETPHHSPSLTVVGRSGVSGMSKFDLGS